MKAFSEKITMLCTAQTHVLKIRYLAKNAEIEKEKLSNADDEFRNSYPLKLGYGLVHRTVPQIIMLSVLVI